MRKSTNENMKGHKSFGFQLTKTIKGKIYILKQSAISSSVLETALHNHAPPHPTAPQPEKNDATLVMDKDF